MAGVCGKKYFCHQMPPLFVRCRPSAKQQELLSQKETKPGGITMASINSLLGGPAGLGEGVFTSATKAAGDNIDGSVEVDISSVFGSSGLKFFDQSYSSIYINANGVISFNGPSTDYSGDSLGELGQPAIAAFWTDHNVNNGGEIYWDLDPDAGTVTITWHEVAPYDGAGTNTYQVVLKDAGEGNVDVEFIYEDIGWHQSGGSSAVTGITDGQGADYPLDGSGQPQDLVAYQDNDFGGGDEDGTFVLPLENGVPNFQNGTVDGTGGDDNFSVSILGLDLDVDGDAVTSGADSVLTGLGDDVVDAGDGADTIHGGDGSDTILGGAGDDQIHGDGISETPEPVFTTINASNLSDTSSGFRVSARNVENGALTEASVDNIDVRWGGFGAGGSISDTDSNVHEQTGFDLQSGLSEELIVDFDAPIDNASVTFATLYSGSYGEQAQWSVYDNGTLVAQATFTESGFNSGSGTIDLSGLGQFDQIILRGLPQTDGSDGSDFFITEITFENPILASEFNDSLSGGDGVDEIFGGIGSDTISGDAGDDTILGEDGDDQIDGGVGNDTVLGGAGSDVITGGTGSDLLDGGDGDDFLKTGDGQDTAIGGEGNDTLMNAAGDDSLVGGTGDDLIVATQGQDTLEGGEGNDTLMGGTDGDSLDGGDDNDLLLGDLAGVTFNETGNDGVALASNITDFPATQLTVEITFASDNLTDLPTLFSYATAGEDDTFRINEQSGTLRVEINGVNYNTTVPSSSLFDGNMHTLAVTWDSSTGAIEVFVDGASAHSGVLQAGETLVQGGTVALAQDQDVVGGGFASNQSLDGTIYGVRLYDDVRTPSEILDTTFAPVADTSDPNLVANWVADPEGASFTDQSANGYPMATSGDVQSGWSSGNDTLLGGSGDDTIYGGGGDDFIEGGDGNDVLMTGLGNDTLMGGAGNDTLKNSDGDDSLDGGAGNDSIVATGGEDTLRGGTGDDTMEGGADADTFIIEDGFGNDSITGGEGTTDSSDRDYDTIDLSTMTGPVTVTFTGDEQGTITDGTDTISFTEIEHVITTDQADVIDATGQWPGLTGDQPGINVATGGGDDTVFGGRGGDTIDAGSGNDSIDGDYGDDSIEGGSGNDTLIGGQGNDTLSGGADNDSLDAGNEADTLEGGAGDDTLTGGDGDDVFVYNVGDGADTITDFNTGNSGTLGDGDTTNNDFIDLSNFYDSMGELRADFDDDGVLNQSNDGVDGADYSDNHQFGSGDSLTFQGANRDSFSSDNTGVVCFVKGTLITTQNGARPIETLRAGDMIQTRDNGLQRVAWIGQRTLGQNELGANPHLKPVFVSPDLTGGTAPLLVSPQHGVLLRRDGDEVLVRAKHLAALPGGQARVMAGRRSVSYYHLLFESHQIIFAQDAPAESLYPGKFALNALPSEAKTEVFELFPDLTSFGAPQAYGLHARPFSGWRRLPSHLRDMSAVMR